MSISGRVMKIIESSVQPQPNIKEKKYSYEQTNIYSILVSMLGILAMQSANNNHNPLSTHHSCIKTFIRISCH